METKNEYNDFLNGFGGTLIGVTTLVITAFFVLFGIEIISNLFAENAFAMGWQTPVLYVALCTIFAVLYLFFSIRVLWYFAKFWYTEDVEEDEKKKKEEAKESRFDEIIKYYIMPALFGLLLLGALLLMVADFNLFFTVTFFIIFIVIIVQCIFLADKEDRFLIGSLFFLTLITITPVLVWAYYTYEIGISNREIMPYWLLIIMLFILPCLWLILGLLRSKKLIASVKNTAIFIKGVYSEIKEDFANEKKIKNELPELLRGVTAQKLLAEKISQLQVETEKCVSNEFDEIREKYIIQPIDENLEVEPDVKKLVERNYDYRSIIEKIEKQVSGAFKKLNFSAPQRENSEEKNGQSTENQ